MNLNIGYVEIINNKMNYFMGYQTQGIFSNYKYILNLLFN